MRVCGQLLEEDDETITVTSDRSLSDADANNISFSTGGFLRHKEAAVNRDASVIENLFRPSFFLAESHYARAF